MPQQRLTDDIVRRAKPADDRVTEYRDATMPGLALRVSTGGTKSWTIRYRTEGGTQRRLSLGKYPAVSLASARTNALDALSQIAKKTDPADAKKIEQAEARAAKLSTIQGLGDRYFTEATKGRHRPNARPKRQSTIELERGYFDRLVLPGLGKRPVAKITRAEIQDFINQIADETSPSAAVQCRNVLRQIFTFARWMEVASDNPCEFVHVPSFASRERTLTDEELRAVWHTCLDPTKCEGLNLSEGVALAIRLAAITLQRRGEVTGIHTDELDFNTMTWTIPKHRTKNNRTHVVPISDEALAIINSATDVLLKFGIADGTQAYSGYLFPSPRDKTKPITSPALSKAFRRIRTALELDNIRPHDLRRTGATALTSEAIGIPRFIVSQVLNHSSDAGDTAAVTAVYDRNAYLPEKRRALNAWAAHLMQIVGEREKSPTVVNLR